MGISISNETSEFTAHMLPKEGNIGRVGEGDEKLR